MKETTLQTPKLVKKVEEEVLQVSEIPLQPLVKPIVNYVVSLLPMEVNGGADIHLQPMKDPKLEQVDAYKQGCDPMGSLCWSRLLTGPMIP